MFTQKRRRLGTPGQPGEVLYPLEDKTYHFSDSEVQIKNYFDEIIAKNKKDIGRMKDVVFKIVQKPDITLVGANAPIPYSLDKEALINKQVEYLISIGAIYAQTRHHLLQELFWYQRQIKRFECVWTIDDSMQVQ